MPCFELFDKQPKSYKNQILGSKNILKVAIEAGLVQGWNKYIGDDGVFIGMESFGASGKAEDLYQHFGITAQNVKKSVLSEIKSRRKRLVSGYKDKDDYFDEIDRYKEEVMREVDGDDD